MSRIYGDVVTAFFRSFHQKGAPTPMSCDDCGSLDDVRPCGDVIGSFKCPDLLCRDCRGDD